MSDVAWVERPAVLPSADLARLVVEASAGTGKTYFLEHRVVDLMLGAGAGLDQILLVTFTEKATAELRERIRALLDRVVHHAPGPRPDGATERSHWRVDAAARASLRAALWSFERAAIFTIHGFCQRVLGDFALAGRRPFDQTQVAEDVAFERTWRRLLRTQFARDPDDAALLEAYLAGDGTIAALGEMLAYALRTDAPLRPAPRAHDARPRAELAALRAQLDAIGDVGAFVRSIGGHGGRVDKVTRVLRRVIDRLQLASTPRAAILVLDALAGDNDEGLGYLLKASTWTANKGVRQPAEVPALAAAFAALAPSLVPLKVTLAHRFVPPLRLALDADKSARGQFDYQDLLARTAELLASPRGAEVAARLRERLPWAMIDEFQDTDPLQWQIFRTVWGDPSAPARGLVIVGDPKQAIYSFRGADVATYLAARQQLLTAGAASLDLEVNHRATAPLIEATNAILRGPDAAAPLLTGAIGYPVPVRAGGAVTPLDDGPALTLWRLHSPGKARIDDVRAAHLGAIAAEIRRLTNPAAPLAFRDRGGERALTPGDVYVLTRTNAESDAVAAGLRRHGVPCALLMAEYLMDTPEARDVADLLDAIAQPRARATRLRAWRTAFFAVPWDDLPALADAPDHHELVAPLFAWAELARRRQFHRLFHQVLTDSQFAARALALGRGERAVVNVRHVFELLLVELDRTPIDLPELAHRLRGWIALGEKGVAADDSDVQRAETDAAAVKIMTAHRAKGLEAAAVFLFGGTQPFPGGPPLITVPADDGDGRVTWADGREAAKEARKREEALESERLAYVALTRAKVRMYLPWYDDGVVGSTAAYQPIQQAITRWADAGVLPPHTARIELAIGADDDAPPPPDGVLAGFTAPPPVTARAPRLELARRAGGALVSYSRLAHGGDAGASVRLLDQPDEARIVVGDDDLPPGVDTGLFLHEVLEHVAVTPEVVTQPVEAWAAEPATAALLDASMRRHRIPPRARAHAERVVHATLTQPPALGDGWRDAPLPALASAPRLAREVEFTYPRPQAGAGYVRGYIDALVAWDDRLWVIDYKSDVLPQPSHAAAAALVEERYREQARLYGLAGARAQRPGLRLGGLLYWFVRDQLVVPIVVDDATLAGWTRWLAELEVAA
ncbi:MAG: UvrD-helicase domain-containing protein [Kofleriaceae bacterium]